MIWRCLTLVAIVFVLGGCSATRTEPTNSSTSAIEQSAPNAAESEAFRSDSRAVALAAKRVAIEPFFKPTESPEPDEWLSRYKEPGQTFEEYVAGNPTRATAERNRIYIQPAGRFTPTQAKVVRLTADYMAAFYGLKVVVRSAISIDDVPEDRRRKNPNDGTPQVLSGYFLDELLPKLLPNDAAAFVCLTPVDLYPEPAWNFVFGQANLATRVGVYSLARFGDPDGGEKKYRRFVERTLKVSMHETGHMFSIRHCTKFVCLMSGSLGLNETDRQPIDVCPECAAKIAWAFDYDSADRYERLAEFCKKLGWKDEEIVYRKKADAATQ